MRQQMLSRVLSREAQERLNNVQAVDPKRARRIGDHIIGMARSGQLLQEVRAPHCAALGADARAVATGPQSVLRGEGLANVRTACVSVCLLVWAPTSRRVWSLVPARINYSSKRGQWP